ncbi:MAG: SDR family NAD(P)-dependent oxidoreductase [Clostridia bacterium]|nr:SDR family NAD(P)-dependent oxidoreductase [Clostridia bacterium]
MTNKSLIVGGGSGLGFAMAKSLADENKKVIVADCRFSEEDDRFEKIQIDLSKDKLDHLFGLDIDTLIITAGIGRLDYFNSFSDAEIEKVFRINTISAMELVRAYYSRLDSEDNFNIAIVTSIAGIIASPLYSVYSATKGALVKFIEAVNAELAFKKRVNRILNVAPGYIGGTNFHGGNRTAEQQVAIKELSNEIICKMLQKEELYVPKGETYNNVIKNYQANPVKFGTESIGYKLKNNKLQTTPQVKVGYLTGTFDLFHIGHLNLLRNAKKYCDVLYVGVHPDGKHKNKEVFIPLEERIEIVKNISYVDDAFECGSEDIDTYEKLQYDYLFVGSDYKGTERFTRYEEFFKGTKTQIIYLPYTTQTSSSKLRQILNDRLKK